jgi:hypothetical protein
MAKNKRIGFLKEMQVVPCAKISLLSNYAK